MNKIKNAVIKFWSTCFSAKRMYEILVFIVSGPIGWLIFRHVKHKRLEKEMYKQIYLEDMKKQADLQKDAIDIVSNIRYNKMEDIDVTLSGRDSNETNKLLLTAFEEYVDIYLIKGTMGEEYESKLNDYVRHFNLGQLVTNNSSNLRLIQSHIIRDIENGILPVNVSGGENFILSKGEKLVYVFNNVMCYEDVMRREYSGSTGSVSFSMGKGSRVRMGGGGGTSKQVTELKPIGEGTFVLSTGGIYFRTMQKSDKIPFVKIVVIAAMQGEEVVTPTKYGTTQKIKISNGLVIYTNRSRNIFDGFPDCEFARNLVLKLSQI